VLPEPTQRWGVKKAGPHDGVTLFDTVSAAVQAFVASPGEFSGEILILDSDSYAETLTGAQAITLGKGRQLSIVAAGAQVSPTGVLLPGPITPRDLRPHVLGDIEVKSADGGGLLLHGLLIEGKISVLAGDLERLALIHSTAVPASGGIVTGANERLTVRLERAICGPVSLDASAPTFKALDSIVDGALDGAGADLDIEGTTIFGTTDGKSIYGSDSIFLGLMTIARLQSGCLRFSFVPFGSTAPRRYRCQPYLALEGIKDAAVQASILANMVPTFTSVNYGDSGYGQLSLRCPVEIQTGAEDTGEMGAFWFLKNPLREANLRACLDEYLRFGLDAGLIETT
jgi:hypothetical protein